MRLLELFVVSFCILLSENTSAFTPFSGLSRPSFSQRTLTRHSVHYPTSTRHSRQHGIDMLFTNSANGESEESRNMTLRDRLRQVTGFSFTAFRATLRGLTGISLTALYASAVATTSSFVRNTMKIILSFFPTWFRYFLQPFLVLYYTPLFIIRGTLGPSVRERRAGHEHLVESWKQAVNAAEEAQDGGYWPVHVNDEGKIVPVLPPDPDEAQVVDIADAVAESVEVSMKEGEGTD